jgi:DNA-binding transcriptional LysR family regulator
VVAVSSPLDLESLRCFVAAVEQQSFRGGAKACALSPAAFGDRIRRLEDELGAALFTRTTRKLALTPHAERLLPQARRALEEAQRCRAIVHDHAKAPFELKIGTRFELGLSFIVPALKRLERALPERRLHVYFGDTSDLLPRVLRGELSCMITSARLVSPGLAFARLHEEHYVLVAKSSLVKHCKLNEPGDARRHVLLDLHEDLPLFRYFLDARSAKEVWQFRELSYLGTIAALRARALEGAGLCVLPQYFVKDDLAAGRLVRLMPKTKLPSDWFRLVWRAGHQREPELQQLAAELSELALR